jgi:putative N-acetyltransferase (TIGR04045 family)
VKGVLPSRSSSRSDAPELVCRVVTDGPERAAHHAIRRAVFVAEQGVFTSDDTDTHDASAATVHVLGLVDGVPAGTVRLYPLEVGAGPGLWKGDRLAVLPEYRHVGIGPPLVRFAVATAGGLGGSRMVAQIQPANVRFFSALGWSPVGAPADYLGIRHQQMSIELRP